MDKTLYIWLAIWVAIATAGAEENVRNGYRWIALFIAGGLMLAFYL